MKHEHNQEYMCVCVYIYIYIKESHIYSSYLSLSHYLLYSSLLTYALPMVMCFSWYNLNRRIMSDASVSTS